MKISAKCKIIVVVLEELRFNGFCHRILCFNLLLKNATNLKAERLLVIKTSDAFFALQKWKTVNRYWDKSDYPDIKSKFAWKHKLWDREEILIINANHGLKIE